MGVIQELKSNEGGGGNRGKEWGIQLNMSSLENEIF